MAWGAFKKEAASEPERWSVSCILYVCQPLQGLLFCAYKEKILPLVRLIDKIVQGLAGIVGKIPENSRFHMIIDKLLQNFPCKPGAAPVSYLTVMAKSRADCASVITGTSLEITAISFPFSFIYVISKNHSSPFTNPGEQALAGKEVCHIKGKLSNQPLESAGQKLPAARGWFSGVI